MDAENARLRTRVADLERQNAALLRENAALKAGAPTTNAEHVESPLRRRLGSLTAAVATAGNVAAAVELTVAEAADDLGFLEGLAVEIDPIGTALYLKAKELMPQGGSSSLGNSADVLLLDVYHCMRQTLS